MGDGRYDGSSRNSQLGDGFKDHILSELSRLGEWALDFRAHLLGIGYSEHAANDMEQLEGDVFLPDYHVFLECKTSEKWRDSVCIKPRALFCFIGPHKFYVTSFFDGTGYVDVRVHQSGRVRKSALEKAGFYTFDTAAGPSSPLELFLESLRRAKK